MKKITSIAVIIAASIGITACGSSSNPSANSASANTTNVVQDLEGLLHEKGVTFTTVPYCTHKSGNDYVCEVDGTDDGTVYPSVTDDGASIYVSGL